MVYLDLHKNIKEFEEKKDVWVQLFIWLLMWMLYDREKQVRSDNDASEVDILGRLGTF